MRRTRREIEAAGKVCHLCGAPAHAVSLGDGLARCSPCIDSELARNHPDYLRDNPDCSLARRLRLRRPAPKLWLVWSASKALKIEEPLLAKIEAHPPEGLPESAQRILAQKAWREAAEGFVVGARSIQVEGNVIRLERTSVGGNENG